VMGNQRLSAPDVPKPSELASGLRSSDGTFACVIR
jgi:hypothetical protein